MRIMQLNDDVAINVSSRVLMAVGLYEAGPTLSDAEPSARKYGIEVHVREGNQTRRVQAAFTDDKGIAQKVQLEVAKGLALGVKFFDVPTIVQRRIGRRREPANDQSGAEPGGQRV